MNNLDLQHKIYEALDRSLKVGKRNLKKPAAERFYVNSAFLADDNTLLHVEKEIENWSKENDINLYVINKGGFEIDHQVNWVTIDNMQTKIIAPSPEQIDKLSKPNTVLFFKNIHQMDELKYRRWLLELINNNGCQATVSDNREEKGYKTLNGLLFAIATHKKEYDHTLFCMDAKDSFRITTIE